MAIAPLREDFGLQPELGSDEMDDGIWESFFKRVPDGQCREKMATGATAGNNEAIPFIKQNGSSLPIFGLPSALPWICSVVFPQRGGS